jgi:CubicO group peptidase (beta-lactamase class C family)
MLAAGAHAATSWPAASPQALGLDAAKLAALQTSLAARNTKALLIVRHGKIAFEWYAEGVNDSVRHGTASLAKAAVGGLSLLIAANDGYISADDLASKYIPSWRNDPLKSGITIRQLATHTSGVEDAEEGDAPHDKLTGWKGAFWKREPDPFSIALSQAPVLFEPGSSSAYSNPGMAALAYAVTASLRQAPQKDIRALLRERVLLPMGVPDSDWSIGYGRPYELDGLQLYANWGGGLFTPRAMARIGQLILQRGEWDGKQLIRRDQVEKATAWAGIPAAPDQGLAWHTNVRGDFPQVPRDAFFGSGDGHQVMLIVPSLGLVAVRNGRTLKPDDIFVRPIVEHIFNPLMDAVVHRTPYAPSTVIRRVDFAPEAEIARQAIDSDNWPIAWGKDGHQYTAYGDGWGFDPRTDRKLSLGFARIEGPPESFRGVNIRSKTGERTGEGAKGAKASGMLMVAGVLYMWVRNVDNAQLAWSRDLGKTWQWGFKFDQGFGSPAFLNFGANYAGARDNYVYAYSQDGPSAYERDDRVALARAPKTRMTDRQAWEFFAHLDASGRPVWTPAVERRGAVFSFPWHCQRVDAVYNPGLRRYLLAVGYNHRGGWGLYDAPQPWGPWTVAYHTEDWGLGGTHGYRLPAKWISRDGRIMYLLFSGVKRREVSDDAFCLRRMTLDAKH